MGKHTVREGFFYTKGDTWAHREADDPTFEEGTMEALRNLRARLSAPA
jgi:hypothetical protein